MPSKQSKQIQQPQQIQTGLILIGDELLNGSRQDKHMAKAIEILKARGMSLNWVRIIGDSESEIVATLKQTNKTNDIVFSFGGIGATPDDLTRASAAKAFGQKLVSHPEAKDLIEKHFGEDAYPHRIRMSELPENASIIPNPVNQVPGFKVVEHHFVPGFPDMAWPMIEWVLDTYYSDHFNKTPDIEWRWDIMGVAESSLMDMMTEILETFPNVRLSSLPSTKKRGELIDFGLKGQEIEVKKAAIWLETHLDKMKIAYLSRVSNG